MTTQAEQPPERVTQRRRKEAAAGLSIVSNSTLVVLKFIVGFWTGSVSVLSEALHSATDMVASSIAFLSVRVSDIPPDDEHPYGHGKVESLSGLAEALLIFAAAIYIIYESVSKLSAPVKQHPLTADAGMAVMGLSVVVNVLMSRHLFQVARETDSQALHADAEHLRTDVLTSLGVFLGLLLTRLTGHSWLDPVSALCVALFIMYAAFRLTHNAYHLLLDARLPPEDETQIRAILEADSRVLGYHKLRTRKSGSFRHADVHVQIDDDCTLVVAHDITEELEDRIRAALPATHINIHIEPYRAELRHQQEVHGVALPDEKRDLHGNIGTPGKKA